MNPELETRNAEPPAHVASPPDAAPPGESQLASPEPASAATPARRRRAVPPEKAGLLLIGEAAAQMRCSVKTVRNLVKSGRLRAIRLTGGKTDPLRFRLLDVQRFINSCEEAREGEGQ
jgi:excisionase family DNA binding protein